MKDEKVRIENSADLYSLPISKIKNTKLYNFSGKYYDKIYDEALKIERCGRNVEEVCNPPEIVINSIRFEMQYKTEFGQKLVMCGSSAILGSWDANKALDLQWSEGGIWQATIPAEDYIEYKFVFCEGNTNKKWEGGNNRTFSLVEIKSALEKEKIVDDSRTFNTQTDVYLYNHPLPLITVKCQWKN